MPAKSLTSGKPFVRRSVASAACGVIARRDVGTTSGQRTGTRHAAASGRAGPVLRPLSPPVRAPLFLMHVPLPPTVGDADFVLVDWGATNGQGYRSDLTRIVVTGTISPKLEKLYGVVLRPNARRLRQSGREFPLLRSIRSRGTLSARPDWGKNFGHGLGTRHRLGDSRRPAPFPNSKDSCKPGWWSRWNRGFIFQAGAEFASKTTCWSRAKDMKS